MRIFSIDPGPTESAYVIISENRILKHDKVPNNILLGYLNRDNDPFWDVSVIEMIASYGMAVGKEVFETCVWIGRFMEAIMKFSTEPTLIYRKDVKMHLCGSMKAKDANIRQALIDIYGPPGTKKNPGVLYGVTKDQLAALAVAITYRDNYGK